MAVTLLQVLQSEAKKLLQLHVAVINRDTLRFTACDPSCASCFPDNPKCMSCVAGTALHHGKCIPQCPTHNYLDAHGRCRGRRGNTVTRLIFCISSTDLPLIFSCFSSACHSSCASCWGPSVSQCSQCPGGLLLHQGQCVEACGEGLYPQDNTCHSRNLLLLYCSWLLAQRVAVCSGWVESDPLI